MAIAPAGRGVEVLAVYSLFLALTTITVALRVYCRAHIQKAFGWDDYFALISWVSLLSNLIMCMQHRSHSSGSLSLPCRFRLDWGP